MAKSVSMFLGAVGVASLGQQLVGVAAGITEGLNRDPDATEHGGVDVIQWGGFGEFSVASVFESEPLAPRQDERVVVVVVRAAVAAAVNDGGLVQEGRVALGSGRGVAHPSQEVRKALGEELVPFSERFEAILFVPSMTEGVDVRAESQELWELPAESRGVAHARDLIGGHPRRVGAEGEVNEIIHSTDVFGGNLSIRIEPESFAISVGKAWLGDVDPGLGALNPLFHVTDSVEILIEFLLVMFAEPASHPVGIFQHQIQHAGGAPQSATMTSARGIASAEESFENLPWLVECRNGTTLFVVG